MIKKLILKLCKNRIIRYIFFGGLTTLVNLCSYFVLRNIVNMNVNIANVISIIIAILFAYEVNSKFVFDSKCYTIREKSYECLKFISARISTMIIEVMGVCIMTELIFLNDMVSKIMIQFIVLILNYAFSKIIVFKSNKTY